VDPAVNVRRLLDKYGLRPKKSLGQNFLVDENALAKIVTAGEVSRGDVILEVGAGPGGLTRQLAQAARLVIAVEIDQNMLGPLGEVVAPFPNVVPICGDILQLDPAALVRQYAPDAAGYAVIANIPYYISSAIIRHLLECALPPRRIALTVQREVAERMCAAPPRMNLLAVSVQVYGSPRIAARIPAGAFHPPPKVDSAVVRIDVHGEPRVTAGTRDIFFQLAKAGFGQKRKTLHNALAGGLGLPKELVGGRLEAAGIAPLRRAETLTIEEWGRLAERFRGEDFGLQAGG
jgi:16S rRNA (adenine1518-N6/adenine1519-N6)-dimethyltransferase